MKKIVFIGIIIVSIFLNSCETYPNWEDGIEYSDTYPLSGEWYVNDYYPNDSVSEPYLLYIYNKSYNPTGDSLWIDNRTGHPTVISGGYPFSFKIKAKANLVDLTFNCSMQGNVMGFNPNPIDSAIQVTVTESKVWDMSDDITDSTPDSISFKFTYFDKYGEEVNTIKVAGHRKTGWEEPNYDDDM